MTATLSQRMAMDGAVLAIDVGTSSCRASLYDLRGRAIRGRVARVKYAPTVTADGGAELDASELLDRVYSTLDELLATGDATPIVCVATDTFWHSVLGVDVDGRPLTPVLPWLDARSRADVAPLRDRVDLHSVHARTGCVLHWTYWPAKLAWLRRTRPDVFTRVARWVSFGEFLVEQVTGQVTTSVSMASGTGLLDVHTCDWDGEMLAAVDIDRRHLSPIVPLRQTAESNRAASARWPRLRGVRWLPAIADGACSSIGAGCTTPAHAAVMIGTSAAERVVWTPSDRFEIPWGAWCYRVDERRAVVGGALNDGGNLFEWLRSTLRLPSVAAAEAQLATLEPDGHGLTVLPFWGGERSPGWADDATGATLGLRLHTTPVEILRACMEAVALRLGALDELLRPALGSDGALVATGGALLRSPTWMQIVADVMGRPLFASAEPEASSRGAALLALESLGVLEQPLEARRPAVTRRFEPIAAHTERYRGAAERQRRQYDALIS